jgi:hypothetical protein
VSNVPASGLPADNQLVYVAGQAGPLPPFAWTISTAGSLDPPAWVAGTSYAQGNVVVLPNGAGYALYTRAGVAGASAPTMQRAGVQDGTAVCAIVPFFGNGLILQPTLGACTIGPLGNPIWPLVDVLPLPSYSTPANLYVTASGTFSLSILGAP